MEKPWYESITVWGGIIAALSGLLGPIGYSLSPEEQQKLAGIIAAVAAGIGGLVAIIGRLRAGKCTGDQKPPPASEDTSKRISGILMVALALSLFSTSACIYSGPTQDDPAKAVAAERWLTASEVALSIATVGVCIACPPLCTPAQAAQEALRLAIDSYRTKPDPQRFATARAQVDQVLTYHGQCPRDTNATACTWIAER